MKPIAARFELLALVAATRPDLDQEVLDGALDLAARTPGWTWERVLKEITRIACDEDSTAWGLRDAVNPQGTKTPTDSPVAHAEHARALLAAALHQDDEPDEALNGAESR
jgi:hypothetical protein